MKPVDRSEILGLGEYEQVREAFRRRIIELKRNRRVSLGPNMTVLFENRDTVLYQIQEMLRTERITREDAIAHEIETYNELVPGEGCLSATIFIEYPDKDERERMLAALAGVEGKFYLRAGGVQVAMKNETRGILPDRTTAVQYAKIELSGHALEALRAARGPVKIGVAHDEYDAETELLPRTIQELAEDLKP